MRNGAGLGTVAARLEMAGYIGNPWCYPKFAVLEMFGAYGSFSGTEGIAICEYWGSWGGKISRTSINATGTKTRTRSVGETTRESGMDEP